jgi:YHS domain-containing protein
MIVPCLLVGLLGSPALAQQQPPAPEADRSVADGEAAEQAEPVRAVEHHNLGKQKLALEGYDPVAYFPEGGGKALEGRKTITLEHEGALYRFASEANRERFRERPDRYEPAYGGWCAWAMAQEEGEKVEVDPRSFLVTGDRLFVFYDGFFADTRKSWLKKDPVALETRADKNWKRLSEELPRRVPLPKPEGSDDGNRPAAEPTGEPRG